MRLAVWAGTKGAGKVHALTLDKPNRYGARTAMCGIAGRFLELPGPPTLESLCAACTKKNPGMKQVAVPGEPKPKRHTGPVQDEAIFDGSAYDRGGRR